MKTLLFFLIISLSSSVSADTIEKWVDEKGTVHYGDRKAAEAIKNTETLEIEETFDQQSYEEGVQRHKETEQFAEEYEKERLAEEEQRKQEEADSKPTARPPAGGIAVPFPVGEKHPRGDRRKDKDPSQLPAHRPPRQKAPMGKPAPLPADIPSN